MAGLIVKENAILQLRVSTNAYSLYLIAKLWTPTYDILIDIILGLRVIKC